MEELSITEQRNLRGGYASPVIKGGYGKADYYRYYRQHGGSLLRDPFARVLRKCNKALTEELIDGANDYTLPCGIGRVSFRKRKNKAYITPWGVKTTAFANWKETMKLWESNPQAKRNKVIVRHTNMSTNRYAFRIKLYTKLYKNKDYFSFRFKRSFKRDFAKRVLTYNKPKIEPRITKLL